LFRNRADDLALADWLRQRIWPYEGALDEVSMRASADLGLAELVRGGTTTILDMGSVHHTDAIGEALLHAGIRAGFGKAMMDSGEGIPGSLRETRGDSVMESLALAQRWGGRGGGKLRYAFCPRFAFSCSTELLREVGEIVSDSTDFLLHTHANETEWEVGECRWRLGKTNIEHLRDAGLTGPRSVFAHSVHVVDRERSILAETGTCVAHCPSSNLKLGSGIADIPRLWEAGVLVGLGADGAPCNNNLDAFVEMRLAALLQKVRHGPTSMPAERVLRMATLDGARALGLGDQVGSLECGKRADLVLMNLNEPRHGVASPAALALGGDVYARIVYSAQSSDVTTVISDGEVLVRDGELVRYDVDELRARAREALDDVSRRLGASSRIP
jgi:cytosine/adenosine deaminase-related metal-dependent hydrolase